jgi:hypothetical protein
MFYAAGLWFLISEKTTFEQHILQDWQHLYIDSEVVLLISGLQKSKD